MNAPDTPSPPGLGRTSHPTPPEPPLPIAGDPLDPENFKFALIRRTGGIFSKKIGDHYVLFDPLGDVFLRLNEGAHRLWVTVGDHERIPVSEVIGKCKCNFEDGLSALIALAEKNFVVIVAFEKGKKDA